ncbi:MAG: peptidylprolyl isomerase [Gemmatimonadetes bacterium]|nr:peptidylprolyl isomerase [Gemmatimonadota bacterium]
MKRTPTAAPALLLALALAGCAPSLQGGAPAGPGLHGDAEIDAAATLLRMEDRRELELSALEPVAASPNRELRRRAALAVGRIRDARGLPLLVRMLGDADTAVAATAAFALGNLGDTAAVAALVPLVDAGRIAAAPTVTGEAASSLGKLRTSLGRTAVESLLRTAPLDGPGAREAVGQALLAVWKFPRAGADLPVIIRWTAARDPELRWRAAYALTRRPAPQAAPTLASLVGDADWRVRSFAVRGLAAPLADSSSVTIPAARRLLLAALRDPSAAVRINAARTLGTHGDSSSAAALAGLLTSGDPLLAITAAESLERLGTSAAAAAPTLRTIALDTTRTVSLRAAALQALAGMIPRAVADVAGRFAGEGEWRARAAAARAYARLGPATRPELVALVHDPDPRVGAAAMEAAVGASEKSMPTLRPLLLESLGASDVIVRTNALAGLAQLADTTTLGAVLDAYARAQRDTIDDAALGALDALDALRRAGAPAGQVFLARFPRSGDYLVRQRVAALFGPAAQAWGPALPVETGRDATAYRRMVREWVAPALAGHAPRARIVTNRGAIDLTLFAADAPLTVMNFLELAQRGYFDGQRWPRVVPNFVIQGGDPRGDTSGGPGYAIRDEINRHPYETGTLGMALSGPDTGGSQWFVTHSPQPHLDGGYTVFGQVVDGMEVVNRIVVGDTILRITRVR